MRTIRSAEKVQRGCTYCFDAIPPEVDGKHYEQRKCPHEECPYHQLDHVKTYAEYMRKTEKSGLVRVLEALG